MTSAEIIANELATHATRAVPFLREMADKEEDFSRCSILQDLADRLEAMAVLHEQFKGK